MSTMKKMSGIAAAAMLCLVWARPGAAATAGVRDDQKQTEPTVASGTQRADAHLAFDGLPHAPAGRGAADLMSHQGSTIDTGHSRLASVPGVIPECADFPRRGQLLLYRDHLDLLLVRANAARGR